MFVMVDGSECTFGKHHFAWCGATLRGFTRLIPSGANVVYMTRSRKYTLTAPFHEVTNSELRGIFLHALFMHAAQLLQ